VQSSASSAAYVPNWDDTKYRPLKGGSQVRTEKFDGDNKRGMGTIGCLAQLSDGSIVALTTQHVICASVEAACVGVKAGQPRHITCCCCCTYNEIGAVVQQQKTAQFDCAIVKLDKDTADEVTAGGTANEVVDIGTLTGAAQAVCFSEVRKRGAATRLTRGTIVDVLYEGSQILINPLPGVPKFAYYGDSGAVIVDTAGKVVGLLWGADRGTRNRGVANHIGPVLTAMGITIAGTAAGGLSIPANNCGSSPSALPEVPTGSSSSRAAVSSSSATSSSSSRSSISSSSRRSSSSSSSCAPRIVGGQDGRWHAGAIKSVPRLIGCKATIDTMEMRLPCEGSATFDSFSTVWTGITNHSVTKWAQIGITRRRSAGSAAIVQYRKFEVMAGPAAGDYHNSIANDAAFPAIGTSQEYECVLTPATGRWDFFIAGANVDHFTNAGWVNGTGDRVDYTAEVYDLGSQMAGTTAQKCHITNCQFKTGTPTSSSSSSGLAIGSYVDAGLVAANLTVGDASEHGVSLVSAKAIDVWDKNP